jgi:hypothetical protein
MQDFSEQDFYDSATTIIILRFAMAATYFSCDLLIFYQYKDLRESLAEE